MPPPIAPHNLVLRIVLFIGACALCAAPLAASPLLADYNSTPVFAPGEQSPVDAVFLSDGRLVYTDTRANTLRALRRDGSSDTNWISPRGLINPTGIYATPDNRLFVADAGAHRVVQLDDAGAVLSSISSFGHAGPHLCKPSDVAVYRDLIAVADTGNSRVQLFDTSGNHLRSIGKWGSEPGDLVRPVGVEIHNDQIYVCDEAFHRINVYSTEGAFLRSIASLGEQDGLLLRPSRIQIVGDRLFVADSRNHRVQVFDPVTGNILGRWGEHSLRPREHSGKLETPTAIAVSTDGTRAAVCEQTEGRVQLFDIIEPRNTPPAFASLGSAHFDRFMAGGPDTLVLASPDLQNVEVYDLSGVRKGGTPIMVTRFGSQGWGFGKFARIAGLAFDEEKQLVYVTDSAQRRLSIWKLDRTPDDESRFVPTMARLVQTLDFTNLRESDERMLQIAPFVPGAICLNYSYFKIAVLCDKRSGAIVELDGLASIKKINAPLMDRSGYARQADAVVGGYERLFSFDSLHGLRVVAGGWTNILPPPKLPDYANDMAWRIHDALALQTRVGSIEFHAYRGTSEVTADDWTHGPGTLGGVSLNDLLEPSDILAHGSDMISVLDYANHRVIFLTTEGEPVSILGSRPFVMDAQDELKAKRKARGTE